MYFLRQTSTTHGGICQVLLSTLRRRRRPAGMLVAVIMALLLAPMVAAAPGSFTVERWLFTGQATLARNEFTTTDDGTAVQGSEVSPRRMTFGAGAVVSIPIPGRLEPEVWLRRQEYISLNAHDAVVPTQLETGSAVGSIADTLTVALSVPWRISSPIPRNEDWDLSAGAGLALLFRLPVSGVDGTSGNEVGRYWISQGRFLYTTTGASLDYRISDRLRVGAGFSWYLPIHNLWADLPSGASFQHHTTRRWGLRVQYTM